MNNPTLRCLLQSSLVATAVMTANVQAQEYPPAVQAVEKKGMTVIESFEAPGGMTGYVGKMRGQSLTLYLLPDGDHVIVGTLLDRDGENLSKASIDDLITGPKFAEAWPDLENSHWVRDGAEDADTIIYTFTDPNCPYCHQFRQEAAPWIDAGKVQLRHIMVGILKEDSLTKAATILGSDDPQAALNQHQNSFQQGGIEVDRQKVSTAHMDVKANNQLMQELGLRATPSTVYRNDEGKVRMVQGMPDPETLKRMMGPRP